MPVGHPDFGKAFPCPHKVAEAATAQLLDLRLASGLALLSHMTFRNFMADGLGLSPDKQRNLRRAYEVAGTFSENPHGWLLLKGGIGAGKTHLAAAIANARLIHDEPALFIVVPDLLDHLRATYAPGSAVTYDERFESIRTRPFSFLTILARTARLRGRKKNCSNSSIIAITHNCLPSLLPTANWKKLICGCARGLADVTVCEIVHLQAPDFRQSGVHRAESEISQLAHHRDQRFDNLTCAPLTPRSVEGEAFTRHSELQGLCGSAGRLARVER